MYLLGTTHTATAARVQLLHNCQKQIGDNNFCHYGFCFYISISTSFCLVNNMPIKI